MNENKVTKLQKEVYQNGTETLFYWNNINTSTSQ